MAAPPRIHRPARPDAAWRTRRPSSCPSGRSAGSPSPRTAPRPSPVTAPTPARSPRTTGHVSTAAASTSADFRGLRAHAGRIAEENRFRSRARLIDAVWSFDQFAVDAPVYRHTRRGARPPDAWPGSRCGPPADDRPRPPRAANASTYVATSPATSPPASAGHRRRPARPAATHPLLPGRASTRLFATVAPCVLNARRRSYRASDFQIVPGKVRPSRHRAEDAGHRSIIMRAHLARFQTQGRARAADLSLYLHCRQRYEGAWSLRAMAGEERRVYRSGEGVGVPVH